MRSMRFPLFLSLAACSATLLELSDKATIPDTGGVTNTDTGEVVNTDSGYTEIRDADGDGFTEENDCNDNDAAINPKAEEICDGQDNDCDGTTDQDATDEATWFEDLDNDGFGNSDSSQLACDQPTGHVTDDTDCDDNQSTVNPDANEICDGLDNDCSGEIDEDACTDCEHFSFQGHTYQLCAENLEWTDARDTCRDWGYELTTIDSEEEDLLLTEKIIENDFGSTWIGYNDRGEGNEDDFSWVGPDGTDYEGWFGNEPNNQGNNEDCVEKRKDFDWGWNDLWCSEKISFICEGEF